MKIIESYLDPATPALKDTAIYKVLKRIKQLPLDGNLTANANEPLN